tara:strand:- start:1836 stop:2822 length:987 start_codon:yes stop_codon:yes gene_type:complete
VKNSKKTKISIIFCFKTGGVYGLGHYRRVLPLIDIFKKKYKIYIFTNNKKKIHKNKNISLFNYDQKKIFKNISNINSEKKIVIFDVKEKIESLLLNRLSSFTKIVIFHDFNMSAKFADLIIYPIMHLTKFDYKKIRGLKTKNNKILFGKNYIILNKNILREKKKIKQANKIKKNQISILTGGFDPYNYENKICRILLKNKINLKYKLIFLRGSKPISFNLKPAQNVYYKKFNFNDLHKSKLIISTFGVTTYEMLYLKKKIINICYNTKSKKRAQILDKNFKNIKSFTIKDNFLPFIGIMDRGGFKNNCLSPNGVKNIYKSVNELIIKK